MQITAHDSLCASLQSLSVDSVPIASVSFDASDEYAVSGNRDGCVTVWDIPQEKGMVLPTCDAPCSDG